MGLIVPRDVTCAIFCSNESDAALLFSFSLSTLAISLSTSLFRSRAKSLLDLSIDGFLVNSRPRIISRIISVLVVVVLGYSRHSRWNPPRPNDDVTLVHDSPCRTTSGFLFPFVQNEKRAKGRTGGAGKAGEGAHRERAAWQCTRAYEQPSLTELLPLRSLHSREAVVYAPRHPTDAELMILINVS